MWQSVITSESALPVWFDNRQGKYSRTFPYDNAHNPNDVPSASLTPPSGGSTVPHRRTFRNDKETAMQRKVFWASLVIVVLAMLAVAQAQEDYLDVFAVQVRPEKRADFDAIAKKIAAA